MNAVKKLLLIVILSPVFFTFRAFSQTDICEENASGVFWPVKVGIKRHYYTQNGPYISYFNGDTIRALGNVFYKEIEEHPNNEKKITYFREHDGNVFVYDAQKKIEFLELSANITPGYTWEKYDKSWKYTVVDTISTIETPYCEYKHLLNIKAEPQDKSKNDFSTYYNLYYKKGVGLVNLSVSGKGYSFLSIDKSLISERAYLFNGCESLETEKDRTRCTSTKITEFISKNFSYPGKLRKGTIILRFTINENGLVEDIVPETSIKKADGQLQEAIRIVHMMTFIPRKINDKPTKTTVHLPITF
jgi:hypothetical protein